MNQNLYWTLFTFQTNKILKLKKNTDPAGVFEEPKHSTNIYWWRAKLLKVSVCLLAGIWIQG
jgi:hypothetical protein